MQFPPPLILAISPTGYLLTGRRLVSPSCSPAKPASVSPGKREGRVKPTGCQEPWKKSKPGRLAIWVGRLKGSRSEICYQHFTIEWQASLESSTVNREPRTSSGLLRINDQALGKNPIQKFFYAGEGGGEDGLDQELAVGGRHRVVLVGQAESAAQQPVGGGGGGGG